MGRASLQAVSPAGLVIDRVQAEADHLLVIVHPAALDAACTAFGERSSQIHSRYERRLLDLPSQGRPVRLQVQVHRFRCGNAGCARKIFGEVLNADIAPRAARRTCRPEAVVHHIGIALGGRPAASLARRLMLPVSRDTLLRVVRRRSLPSGTAPICIVGIDDFAWKRGHQQQADRLLPGSWHRTHPLAALLQERPGVHRAEKWRRRTQAPGLSAL
jgi:transposase